LPRAALTEYSTSSTLSAVEPTRQPFADPDPFHELTFPSVLDAKRAIADHLGLPLAKLSPDQLEALTALLHSTLAKTTVWTHVQHHLAPFYRG
jgi:hypothetical protein